MKNFIYVFIASLAVISCQNEDLVTEKASMENAKVQLVQVTDKGQIVPVNNVARAIGNGVSYALQFDSQTTYDAIVKQLEMMSVKERMTFIEKYGLQSLQQLAVVADKELERIGAEASSEADFKEKYEAYKAKYIDALISNPYDDSDLSLYVSDGDKICTYLIGESKKVIIGDEVNTIVLSQDLSNSDKNAFVPGTTSYVESRAANLDCGFQEILNGSKKTTCNVHLEPADLFVSVSIGIQKKMWYGWKRDNNRDIYYHIDLNNFTYNYWGPYGNQVNIGCPSLYVFKGTGSIDYKTGYLTGGSRSLSGMIYVWHDIIAGSEMVAHQGVVMNNAFEKTAVFPKCDKGSANSTQINLSF